MYDNNFTIAVRNNETKFLISENQTVANVTGIGKKQEDSF